MNLKFFSIKKLCFMEYGYLFLQESDFIQQIFNDGIRIIVSILDIVSVVVAVILITIGVQIV